jgi:hypothetical protein
MIEIVSNIKTKKPKIVIFWEIFKFLNIVIL